MARTTPYIPVTNSGQLDRVFPIITTFRDGDEVSAWVAALRNPTHGAGGKAQLPGTHITDQLEAAGWDTLNVSGLMSCDWKDGLPNISYSNISRALDYGKTPVVSVWAAAAGKDQSVWRFTVVEKESNLFHGTFETGIRVRLFLSHDKDMPSQLLVRKHADSADS
jgi:hypothetical protein